MRRSTLWLISASLFGLSGCATIIEGTGQSINIATTPPGAGCVVDRMGVRLGEISSTPGTVRIDKSKNDLNVTCSKAGFQQTSLAQPPQFGGTTFGNIIAGGLIGVAVDASSGANYSYPNQIMVQLPPVAPTAPAVPTRPGPAPYALPPRAPGM